MATYKGRDGIVVQGDDTFNFPAIGGRTYFLEIFFNGTTGSYTVSQGNADGSVTFQAETLPTDPTADMVIAATGTARGFAINAVGDTIRVVASSTSAGGAVVAFKAQQHGFA